MASPDNRSVVPDESLLRQIFANNYPLLVSIVRKTTDKCISKAVVPNAFSNGRHSCIVRLEALNGQVPTFLMVAAMQEIAGSCITDLIPDTFQVGRATNNKGREFQFCVMELVKGITLEDAWDRMTSENRRSVVNTIVKVLSALQSVEISDWKVQNSLQISLDQEGKEKLAKAVLGGRSTGLLSDGGSLLSSIAQRFQLKRPFHTIKPVDNPKGLVIESRKEGVGSIRVSDADMEKWSKGAVFCHNNITLRHIVVRGVGAPDGQMKYELAGFYPPSYQLCMQETYLSATEKRLLSLLLKNGLKELVPRSPSRTSLSQAIFHLFKSQQ